MRESPKAKLDIIGTKRANESFDHTKTMEYYSACLNYQRFQNKFVSQ